MDINDVLWSIYNNKFALGSLTPPQKDSVDTIANVSLSKLLFEHTILNKEFQKEKKKSVLKRLVTESLEKFPSLSKWLGKQQEGTVPFTLWVNYKLTIG